MLYLRLLFCTMFGCSLQITRMTILEASGTSGNIVGVSGGHVDSVWDSASQNINGTRLRAQTIVPLHQDRCITNQSTNPLQIILLEPVLLICNDLGCCGTLSLTIAFAFEVLGGPWGSPVGPPWGIKKGTLGHPGAPPQPGTKDT